MLLSRFWYFLLAAAAGAALTAALLAQKTFNREYDSNLANQLGRDRIELELWLRIDARQRLDSIAPLAAHPDVRKALRKASSRGDAGSIDDDVRKQLVEKLEGLNKQLEGMKGDLLFAVNDRGLIAAQLGGKQAPQGAGLGAFPLVRRALAGYMRDDIWVYNDGVYRMAARPVIDKGGYVGAIVYGKSLDSGLAQRLSERLPGDSTVAFFRGDTVLAAHMPAVERAARSEDVKKPLLQVFQSEGFQDKGRTEPVELGENARGIYALMHGSAAHAQVGYAVARPRRALGSPWAIFEEASQQDVAGLPWFPLGGGAIALFLLGMLWMWLERDRPFGRLHKAAEALASRQMDRLNVTDFGGHYRKVAEQINEALDRAVENAAAAAPKRKAADLDEILGPTPASGGASQPYFGFASGGADDGVPEVPPAPGEDAKPGADGAGQPPPKPADGAGQPPPKPASGGGAAPAAPKPPRPPQPPPPAPGGPPAGGAAAPPPPVPPSGGSPASGGGAPAAPPAGAAAPPPAPRAPAGGAPGGAPAAAPPSPQSGDGFDDDDSATTVAPVPEELLAASSGEQGGGSEDDEERHFRDVFEQFTATKQRCGESTQGLTYERFKQTLRKNRDQIVQRHGARKVRFTVYVKEGKAALKATPVKE